jgi:hypothetical protein
MRQRLTWLACAVIGASTATAPAVTSETDWPLQGGGFAQQQFSPLEQITDRNIGGLGLAWFTDIDPDMRYMAELSHQNWNATVLGGAYRAAGMLNFGVDQVYPEIARLNSKGDADIHAYVIEQSWKADLKK